MKKIIVLLCLGIFGCSTAPKINKIIPPPPLLPPQTKIEEPKVVEKITPAVKESEVYFTPKELKNIIAVFSEEIKKNPGNGGAYYNRGIAYFHKKDYKRSWRDVYIAESLGYKFKEDFLEALRKESGREK